MTTAGEARRHVDKDALCSAPRIAKCLDCKYDFQRGNPDLQLDSKTPIAEKWICAIDHRRKSLRIMRKKPMFTAVLPENVSPQPFPQPLHRPNPASRYSAETNYWIL